MKILIIGAALAALLFSVNSNSFAQGDLFVELKSLYGSSQYFKLNNMFNLSKSNLEAWQQLYFESLLLSLFNKPEDSNEKIKTLLNDYPSVLNDSLRNELYKAMLINYINLFDYQNSLTVTEYIISNFSGLIDSTEKKEYLNSGVIWKAAKDLKHKNAIIKRDSRVRIEKDMAGYVNIPLKINGTEVEFVFDTGANISTVTRSFARKLSLKMLIGEIEVGTSTDKKVKANLAYADSVNIGNFTCYNALFLVVDDELFSFAGGLYVIDGIVGHPIIKEMRELRLSKDELFIPAEPVKKELKNFVLDGLTPIVNIVYKKDTLEFSFDSGAKKTALHYPFFEKYKADIVSKYEPDEIILEGAGGEMKYKGYIIDELTISVSGSKSVLEDVKLIAEPFKEEKRKNFYGNLGQDYIKQFKTMIINFENMYIEFTN
jgi:predicted aspartyl protease